MFQTSSLSNGCNDIITGFAGCTQIWKEMAHHLQKCLLIHTLQFTDNYGHSDKLEDSMLQISTVFILVLQQILKNVSKD